MIPRIGWIANLRYLLVLVPILIHGREPIAPQVRDALVARTVIVQTDLAEHGSATGVIWQRHGAVTHVLTVLRKGAPILGSAPPARVIAEPGTMQQVVFAGRVVACDPLSHLAVVEVEGEGLSLPPARAAKETRTGDAVLVASCAAQTGQAQPPLSPPRLREAHHPGLRTPKRESDASTG